MDAYLTKYFALLANKYYYMALSTKYRDINFESFRILSLEFVKFYILYISFFTSKYSRMYSWV